MEIVLNSPMTTQYFGITACSHFPATDIVTHFGCRLAVDRSFAAAHDDGLEFRPSLSIPNALDIVNNHIRPILVAAVTLLGGRMFYDDVFGKFSLQSAQHGGLHIFKKTPLVAFDGQHIVATAGHDLLGNLFLTAHASMVTRAPFRSSNS